MVHVLGTDQYFRQPGVQFLHIYLVGLVVFRYQAQGIGFDSQVDVLTDQHDQTLTLPLQFQTCCQDRIITAIADPVDLVLFGGDAFPDATPPPYVHEAFASQFRRLAE
jgi:hypothetical protein